MAFDVGVESPGVVLLFELCFALHITNIARPHFPVVIRNVIGCFRVLRCIGVVVAEPGFVLQEGGGGYDGVPCFINALTANDVERGKMREDLFQYFEDGEYGWGWKFLLVASWSCLRPHFLSFLSFQLIYMFYFRLFVV